MATTEAKVVNAVCHNKDIHAIIGEDLELFGSYGDVVSSIRDYYYKYKTVPDISLLQEKFKFIDVVDTTAPTPYYMNALRGEFVHQKIETILVEAGQRITDDNSPAILSKLQEKLAKLGKYTAGVRDLDITDAEAAKENIEKLRKASEENDGVPGIRTGFDSIDSVYTTGLAGGHSVVAMGYTGRGKSMFSTALACKVWSQGYKPMIVSLEMSPEEQAQRAYAMMSSGLFTISDLARGDINIDDFDAWSSKKLTGSSSFVVVSNEGSAEVTPNTIQAKIDIHKPDFVVLDYLQLMSDNAKTGAMTPRMLNLSREIKLMAVANNIPIMSITAVTDEDGDKRDNPPLLSQVAWSKGIEYDANLVLSVHRHTDSNLVEVACRKNRHGDLCDFYFDVDFNRGIWEEKFDL